MAQSVVASKCTISEHERSLRRNMFCFSASLSVPACKRLHRAYNLTHHLSHPSFFSPYTMDGSHRFFSLPTPTVSSPTSNVPDVETHRLSTTGASLFSSSVFSFTYKNIHPHAGTIFTAEKLFSLLSQIQWLANSNNRASCDRLNPSFWLWQRVR